MSQSILLRGARQLLTLRGKPGVRRGPDFGNLEIIEDGSVFIQNGKIVCVGSTRRLENLKETRGALPIPVHNCVVMPGFIDPCIKLSLAARPGTGKVRTYPERRKLSDFYTDSLALMRSCLQHGTLNAGVKATSGIHSIAADVSLLRQLARIRSSPVGLTCRWSPSAAPHDPPAPVAAAFDAVAKRKLAQALELNPPFRDDLLRLSAKAALPLNLDWTGGSADRLEALLEQSSSPNVFCHSNLSSAELGVLAETNCTAVFSAGGALLDGPPIECVRDLVHAGGAVALGSGYDALYEPNFNMQFVLALAVRRLGLTIEQAIVATTINAAYAMNCAREIGSLEPGKRAEVLVLNLSDYREIPRRLGVNHVAMAIRDGNLVINRTRLKVGAA